jgi:hypothetical protein
MLIELSNEEGCAVFLMMMCVCIGIAFGDSAVRSETYTCLRGAKLPVIGAVDAYDGVRPVTVSACRKDWTARQWWDFGIPVSMATRVRGTTYWRLVSTDLSGNSDEVRLMFLVK